VKIPTVVRTPDFINVIMYASIDVYIRTAANPLWLCGWLFGTLTELCSRQLYYSLLLFVNEVKFFDNT
jgi:hypothetical protein